jgi:hypothetical protein
MQVGASGLSEAEQKSKLFAQIKTGPKLKKKIPEVNAALIDRNKQCKQLGSNWYYNDTLLNNIVDAANIPPFNKELDCLQTAAAKQKKVIAKFKASDVKTMKGEGADQVLARKLRQSDSLLKAQDILTRYEEFLQLKYILKDETSAQDIYIKFNMEEHLQKIIKDEFYFTECPPDNPTMELFDPNDQQELKSKNKCINVPNRSKKVNDLLSDPNWGYMHPSVHKKSDRHKLAREEAILAYPAVPPNSVVMTKEQLQDIIADANYLKKLEKMNGMWPDVLGLKSSKKFSANRINPDPKLRLNNLMLVKGALEDGSWFVVPASVTPSDSNELLSKISLLQQQNASLQAQLDSCSVNNNGVVGASTVCTELEKKISRLERENTELLVNMAAAIPLPTSNRRDIDRRTQSDATNRLIQKIERLQKENNDLILRIATLTPLPEDRRDLLLSINTNTKQDVLPVPKTITQPTIVVDRIKSLTGFHHPTPNPINIQSHNVPEMKLPPKPQSKKKSKPLCKRNVWVLPENRLKYERRVSKRSKRGLVQVRRSYKTRKSCRMSRKK